MLNVRLSRIGVHLKSNSNGTTRPGGHKCKSESDMRLEKEIVILPADIESGKRCFTKRTAVPMFTFTDDYQEISQRH